MTNDFDTNNILPQITEDQFFHFWENNYINQDINNEVLTNFFKPYIQTLPKFALGDFFWHIFYNAYPFPKVVSVGGSLERLTPFTTTEFLTIEYRKFFEIFHPNDIQNTFTLLNKAAELLLRTETSRNNNLNLSIYTRILNSEGDYKWNCLQYPAIFFDENGNFIFGLAVYTDVHHLMKPDAQPILTVLDSTQKNQQIFTCSLPSKSLDIVKEIPKISPREKEIISLLSQGKASKQIAHILGISKFTVDNHRRRLLKKFNVSSSSELIFKSLGID